VVAIRLSVKPVDVAAAATVTAHSYVSMSRLRVDADRSDELIAAFGDRAGLVDSHDGFVDLQTGARIVITPRC
jgi:hypothetical protein